MFCLLWKFNCALDFFRRHFSTELSANKVVKLIFNGRLLLKDAETLQNCGLYNNCVVHCLIHVNRSSQQSATSNNTSNTSSNNHSTRYVLAVIVENVWSCWNLNYWRSAIFWTITLWLWLMSMKLRMFINLSMMRSDPPVSFFFF